MAARAEKSDPKLWDDVKAKVTASAKGGKPGQWSARKAQAATKAYKEAGGGYVGQKSGDNQLARWGEEEWDTWSGRNSGETGERYLPKAAREAVSEDEYARSTRKKRADGAKGKQVSRQPKDVAAKTSAARQAVNLSRSAGGGTTKADLMERARAEGVKGRSTMSKAELKTALGA